MVFSSPLFIFLFLPAVLTVYVMLPRIKIRNLFLLIASLLFYAWGEIDFILLLLASTAMNYFLGLWIDRRQSAVQRKTAVAVAVVGNIGLLAFFKYADFAVGTVNSMFNFFGIAPIHSPHIPLPIGISFFTFHALSYVIDVYRRAWPAARNPGSVALYIFFFPQLIAGPILRWSSIGPQLLERVTSRDVFADGVRRFAGGLAKKVLIANTVALPADQIFSLPANELSTPDAWFGLLCYTLQIYFDFSGYSDMAIGMGKMFGFKFMENFQFPYVSKSIREFWRRWHISLSTWIRDYIYIPLGGNRISEGRTYFNLITAFFLCGLWHGASWTFVIWGLYHGLFLALERTSFGKMQEKLPQTLRHLYAIFVVMMGWVLFRADTFTSAGHYFSALLGINNATAAQSFFQFANSQTMTAVVLGILFSGPMWDKIRETCVNLSQMAPKFYRPKLQLFGLGAEIGLVFALLIVSAAWLASGTYNPFIYFRF